MDNRDIAAVLREIAVFNDLSGGNTFKSRAFEAVARTVEKLPESLADLVAQDRLSEVKGVGKGTEQVIRELLATGASSELAKLKASFPPGITDLLSLSGMGPKRVKAVYERLGVSTIKALESACREGRVAELDGFGDKTQAKILKAIEYVKTTVGQRLYSEALAIGGELSRLCGDSGLFARVDFAGSLRRGKHVFKDIDLLLVPARDNTGAEVQAFLASLADPDGLIGAGPTKVSIRRTGLQVDFRVVPPGSWPAALQHFTGSKEHNTALRSRAKTLGLKMNEYGVYDASGAALPLDDEASVYRSVGLDWIPPEIREADGEIEAAAAGALPVLVEPGDFRGMVHVHSTWSDGTCSVKELARGCIARGLEWMCLSDHSRSAGYAGGLSDERLREQASEVAALNRKIAPFRIFHGIESDILGDGSLDYPDEVLAGLDFVIGSVHAKLGMGRDEATARLVAAIAHPRLTMLGHPGGGLLLSREGYPWDEQKVLAALADRGVVLEHNCNPHRLDPGWQVLKRAREKGVLVSVNPDAHDLEGFDDVRFGVIMARKAWLGRRDVLNTRTVEEIDAYFAQRRGRGR
ncbi:MAG: DNA polymerase/3'-5' exonuclease PolX [Spirochaetes bacterium]|nr:DNA polymerase/3'-5' exonuclease PolX [Spirochaetota bacterium]